MGAHSRGPNQPRRRPRWRAGVAALAVTLLATAAPSPALADDHEVPIVELGVPTELEQAPRELPTDHSPTAARTATGFGSSYPGEISWLPNSNRFAATTRTEIAFVDPNGTVHAIHDAGSRIYESTADDTDAFITTEADPNRVLRIDATTGTVAESWDLPDGVVLHRLQVTPTTIWFGNYGGGRANNVGSIDRATGTIDLDHIPQVPVSIAPLEAAGLVLVATYDDLKLWDVSVEPATAIAEVTRTNIRQFLADGPGSRLFSIEQQNVRELSLTDLSASAPIHVFQGASGGGFPDTIDNATVSPDGSVFVTEGHASWPAQDIQTFVAGSTTPIMQHDPGYNASPRDLATSGSHVALWISDPNNASPLGDELNVYPLAPTPLTVTAPTGAIEARHHTSITLAGDSLGATTAVTLNGRPAAFRIEHHSSMVVTLPGDLWPGRHTIVTTSRFGSSTFTFDAVQELPRWTWTPCPELTDSISRLYFAYFLREPEEGGFDYWLGRYSSGGWSLPKMSQFFSESPEFDRLYGNLDTGQFLDLVYNNVLGRAADAEGRAYWAARLDSGNLSRGELMLNFSESPEFVTNTNTAPPFAGFFGWYTDEVTFTCGNGWGQLELQPDTTHVDLLAANTTDIRRQLQVRFRFSNVWGEAGDVMIDSNSIIGFFNIGLHPTADAIQVNADFDWAVIESPIPLHTTRSGWSG